MVDCGDTADWTDMNLALSTVRWKSALATEVSASGGFAASLNQAAEGAFFSSFDDGDLRTSRLGAIETT